MELMGRVYRIFGRRLRNMSELDEYQIRVVLRCLLASLTEAMSELVDEVKKVEP